MKATTYLIGAVAGAVACLIGFQFHPTDLSLLRQILFSLLAGAAWPVVLVFGLLGAVFGDDSDDNGAGG